MVTGLNLAARNGGLMTGNGGLATRNFNGVGGDGGRWHSLEDLL